MACGSGGGGVGEPGEKAKASRTIEVQLKDNSTIEPALIPVKPSETVTLSIRNSGTRIHEFFLGDEEEHDDREDLMKDMGAAPMEMADRPNSVTVAPGATEEITWSFPKTGSVTYGCHQPGEYAKGMKGSAKVSE